MLKVIKAITPSKPLAAKKRVAAYTRVSSGKDAMLHSLSAQVSYYSNLIQSNPEWLYCGVYSDEAKTGTKDTRENFLRLLADCRAGKIDLIITKSISRFARNTVTLLKTVRELKAMEVDVYFEEQNIHTMSADGELMLTILASYAQEESLSASENQKWRIKKNFESGKPWNGTMLGYRMENGTLVIEPDEAKVVKRIFADYLSGMGTTAILKRLNAEGVDTRRGNKWHKSSIDIILANYAYTGNLMLQKTFRENHLTKRTMINSGELPMYHVEASHEAIIPLEIFNEAQAEMKRRAVKYYKEPAKKASYPFSGLLVCGICGEHYRRKITKTGAVWICSTYNTDGKAACASKQIPESTLESTAADVLGSLERNDLISCIRVDNGNKLIFFFKDGRVEERVWQDRSRSEIWTDEMKQAASDRRKG